MMHISSFDEVNKSIAKQIIDLVYSSPKKEALENALYRNYLLTSEYDLPFIEMDVYIEGFYITLTGTRCKFSVFAKDNDGELEILTRKPNESKLRKLYSVSDKTWLVCNFN